METIFLLCLRRVFIRRDFFIRITKKKTQINRILRISIEYFFYYPRSTKKFLSVLKENSSNVNKYRVDLKTME